MDDCPFIGQHLTVVEYAFRQLSAAERREIQNARNLNFMI